MRLHWTIAIALLTLLSVFVPLLVFVPVFVSLIIHPAATVPLLCLLAVSDEQPVSLSSLALLRAPPRLLLA